MSDAFVYYHPETAEIVAITQARDAALEADHAWFEAPLSDLDLAAPEPAAAPQKGYVYYRGDWGDVAGVALRPDPELAARHACLEVAADVALGFMDGRESAQDYYVAPARAGAMQLFSRRQHQRVIQLVELDDNFVELTEAADAPLRLALAVVRSEGLVLVRLVDERRLDPIESPVETLVFMLTRWRDPSQVVARIEVDVAELLRARELVVMIAEGLPELSVYTRRIAPTSVEFLEEADARLLRLPLPAGPFLDMVACRPQRVADAAPALTLTLSRARREMRLSLPRQTRMYDRDLADMPLVFVRPRDPTFVLYGVKVSLDALRSAESVPVPAPDWLFDEEFDVLFPHLFQNNCVVEV